MFDWIAHILFTGADEHGNQPVQNITKECHQRQGAPSWRTAPAAAVPAQRTGTQPCTLQFRSLWSNFSPEAHPTACWMVAKEWRRPHQPQLQGRSSSDLVLFLTSKQRSTEHNSQIPRESDGHHCKTLSVCTGYQLCPIQPSHECLRESLSHRLQGTANHSGQRTLPIVLQGAMKKIFFLQQAVDKACQFSVGVVPLICCSGGRNRFVGNRNRNMYHSHGNRTTITHITHALLWWRNPPENKHGNTVEQYECVPRKGRAKFFRNHYVHVETQQKNVWDYLQISRRRSSRRNFIRAIWSR